MLKVGGFLHCALNHAVSNEGLSIYALSNAFWTAFLFLLAQNSLLTAARIHTKYIAVCDTAQRFQGAF